MSTLSDLASRYRWELILFLVIPFVSGVIELLLIVPLIALDTLLGANTITLKLLSIVQPILLAIFYFRVRALGRSMLTLAWSYSLIILATSAVIDPAFEYFYEEGLFWEHVFYWGPWVTFLAPIIVLVWFARLASRFSFNHALLFIALSTALNGSGILMPFVPFPTLDGWIFSWETAILNTVLKLFAVWLLARLDTADDPVSTDTERGDPWNASIFSSLRGFLSTHVLPGLDPTRGMFKEAIIVLIVMGGLLEAVSSLTGPASGDQELTGVMAISSMRLLSWAVELALTIGLAYAVRVRQPPESPTTIEPSATA